MYYNIDFVANGLTVRKGQLNSYDDTIYVFPTLDEAIAWLKTDASAKA